MVLLDGDKISCLFLEAIKYIVSKFSKELASQFAKTISIGVVCTAYSNGAFMKKIESDPFLKSLNVELCIAKTGVKHLKKKAANYDIAIEFEANGHGKISRVSDLNGKMSKLNAYCGSSLDILYLELLSAFIALFNPTVGDAITVMLAVESALKLMNYSLKDFIGLYEPLLFNYAKVKVKDKNNFVCTETEMKLIKPIEVQEYIDNLCSTEENKSELIRCFVRPSGTEDILRVYAEGKSKQKIDEILKTVEQFVLQKFN